MPRAAKDQPRGTNCSKSMPRLPRQCNSISSQNATPNCLNKLKRKVVMSATSETRFTARHVLLVGPYCVLGTGVIDAVAANSKWGITTAARRPPPTYRAQATPSHISLDLMDREGTTKAFSSLDKVTDLVFAAYVEKPTMA